MTKGLPSLDLLVDEMRIIRQDQIQHFDALDSKAGSCWGFLGRLWRFVLESWADGF
jgi:hypothetical protein